MTMSVALHKDFHHFLFWLEAVPGMVKVLFHSAILRSPLILVVQEHTYNVIARHPPTLFKQVPKPPRRVNISHRS
ncbi:hypothetical protein K438DRAFT_1855744, partial [Mycena galopus ATCC 62051]